MRALKSMYIREMKRWYRNKPELFSNIFMGVIFLFIFTWASSGPEIGIDQEEYMLSGILIMTSFMGSLSGALTIINDKSSGFMKEFLIAPIRRELILIAKLCALVTQAGLSVIMVSIFAVLLTDVNFTIMDYVNLFLIASAASFVSSCIGLYLATTIRTTSGFQAVMSLVTMPLMFLSGAYIPLQNLPTVMQNIAKGNPLTYLVALIRNVGSNGDVDAATKELTGLVIKWGDFEVTPLIMWSVVAGLSALLLLISLKRFLKIDMSNKIDWNEVG